MLSRTHPEDNEYRVFNQFDEVYQVAELAERVKKHGDSLGLNVEISHIDDPRIEAGKHYYNLDCQKLRAIGFSSTHTLDDKLEIMLRDLLAYKDRIETKKERIMPKPYWKQ